MDESGPLYDSLFAAAESIGIPRNPDYNGADQEGSRCAMLDQRRLPHERRRGLPQPARARRNLRIDTGSRAQSLLFEGTRWSECAAACRAKPMRRARRAR